MIFPSLLLLTLGLFQRKFLTTCVLVSSPPKQTINSVDEINDDEDSQNPNNVVLIPEQSINLDPDDPLSSINIDYMKNAVILQFRRNSRFFNDGSNNGRNDWETKRRLDNNFMRFGRSNDDNSNGNLMRFGKRQLESYKDQRAMEADEADGNRYERSNGGSSRDSRGDNFMRFGRSDPQNFMRFGRPDNLMRFGRPDNLMRFGRSSSDNLMRFGRPDNLMRFGRQDNLMRFGRPDHFMRFGRNSSPNLMRFGRNDKNFMRFGKLDQNFMRFGKRNDKLIEKLDENKNDNMKNTSNFTDKTKSRNNLDVLFKPHSNSDQQSNENVNDLDFDDNVY